MYEPSKIWEGGRFDAKRLYVMWAKALNGIWSVGHACAVLCWSAASGGCPSTALHKHDQLAQYHPVPWLRWPNISWHQVFRLSKGIQDGFLDSRWVCCEHFAVNICREHSGGKKTIEKKNREDTTQQARSTHKFIPRGRNVFSGNVH